MPGNSTQRAPPERGPELRIRWWRGWDLNPRPSGYEPDELPDCSTPLLCSSRFRGLSSSRNITIRMDRHINALASEVASIESGENSDRSFSHFVAIF